jgi:hypothetical protein
MYENLDQLFDSARRLKQGVLLQEFFTTSYQAVLWRGLEGGHGKELTGTKPDSLRVVVSDVILYPRPVGIAVAASELVGMQHLGHGAVSEQAGSQSHL